MSWLEVAIKGDPVWEKCREKVQTALGPGWHLTVRKKKDGSLTGIGLENVELEFRNAIVWHRGEDPLALTDMLVNLAKEECDSRLTKSGANCPIT